MENTKHLETLAHWQQGELDKMINSIESFADFIEWLKNSDLDDSEQVKLMQCVMSYKGKDKNEMKHNLNISYADRHVTKLSCKWIVQLDELVSSLKLKKGVEVHETIHGHIVRIDFKKDYPTGQDDRVRRLTPDQLNMILSLHGFRWLEATNKTLVIGFDN